MLFYIPTSRKIYQELREGIKIGDQALLKAY